MNSVYSRLRVTLFASFLSLGSVSVPSFAVQDVLETPAVKSDIAHRALLLDVEKVGDRLVSVGARGHILFSDNNGRSWRQSDVPVSVLLTAISFVDDTHGWAVGHGGVVLHTQDGGQTWTKQFDGNSANKMIITQAENKVADLEEQLANASEDEAGDLEWALEDATFALEDANIDAEVGASKPLLDVHFFNRQEGFVVGAYGFLFKTSDGGNSWENYGTRIENQDRFHLNAISQIEGGTVIICGEAGVLFRSEDRGENWETIDSPYSGSFFGVTGTGEEDVALVFGLRGNLFRSEDGGITWEDVDAETENTLMGGDYNGSGKVSIVGNSGAVLLSNDGGRSFTERVRENRLGNVATVFIDSNKLVVVGENGANLTNAAGQNL